MLNKDLLENRHLKNISEKHTKTKILIAPMPLKQKF